MYNFKKGHKVIFKHGEYPVTPNHIMLIPDQQLFNCYGTTSVPTFWMAFSVSRRLNISQKVPILIRPNPAEMEIIKAITGFFRHTGNEEKRRCIFHYSLALLNIVLNRHELQWLDQPVQNNILSVIRHIEKEPANQLTIPQLARMSGLSVRGFSKAFKRSQGTTAAKFISRVRVREAAQLLANSTETVDIIAERTGFPNRDYFSRVFKKITGESPGLFRQKHGIHQG